VKTLSRTLDRRAQEGPLRRAAGGQHSVAGGLDRADEPKRRAALVRKLEREAPDRCVRVTNRPCGYAVQRQMTTARVSSQVTRRRRWCRCKPGERVKTNRRDAASCGVAARGVADGKSAHRRWKEEAVRDLCVRAR